MYLKKQGKFRHLYPILSALTVEIAPLHAQFNHHLSMAVFPGL